MLSRRNVDFWIACEKERPDRKERKSIIVKRNGDFYRSLKGPRINGLVGARVERSFAVIDSPAVPIQPSCTPRSPFPSRPTAQLRSFCRWWNALADTIALLYLCVDFPLFQPIIGTRQLIDRARNILFWFIVSAAFS